VPCIPYFAFRTLTLIEHTSSKLRACFTCIFPSDSLTPAIYWHVLTYNFLLFRIMFVLFACAVVKTSPNPLSTYFPGHSLPHMFLSYNALQHMRTFQTSFKAPLFQNGIWRFEFRVAWPLHSKIWLFYILILFVTLCINFCTLFSISLCFLWHFLVTFPFLSFHL
jgi:hypothetical protein